jgi:clathrin heavy chain
MIKQYLQQVQKANLAAVNEALFDLYAEEEDVASLRSSLELYDNFDQIAFAQRFESHELIEFRRLASYLYKRNSRWRQSVELSKRDACYKDALETTAASGDRELAEQLLAFFVEKGAQESVAATLFTCYDLLRPDGVLESAWMHGFVDTAFPYLIQVLREYTGKVDKLLSEAVEHKAAAAHEAKEAKEQAMQSNMYSQLLPMGLPAPAGWHGAHEQQAGGFGGAPDPYGGGGGFGTPAFGGGGSPF